ncbi:hypothetical protein FPV67DRAFT_1511934 [Lyophyllum atratum]|nr:hypothetical protein FPV67DRAFT_1511934 [Lyophyllum atratum]
MKRLDAEPSTRALLAVPGIVAACAVHCYCVIASLGPLAIAYVRMFDFAGFAVVCACAIIVVAADAMFWGLGFHGQRS